MKISKKQLCLFVVAAFAFTGTAAAYPSLSAKADGVRPDLLANGKTITNGKIIENNSLRGLASRIRSAKPAGNCHFIKSNVPKVQAPVTNSVSGSGTSSDPYMLTTAAELAEIPSLGLDKYYQLGDDIDLSGYGQWTPVGSFGAAFTGTFDGNNHTISGLTIGTSGAPSASSYLGLFGDIENATVENVGVGVGIYLGNSSQYVGGLVGYDYNSHITNCYTTGLVDGSFESGSNNLYIGGLIGYNEGYCNVSCSNCVVSGASDVGGLIGYNKRVSNNCFSAGNVYGINGVGGYVGYNDQGMIYNSFSRSPVYGEYNTGGFAGANYEMVIKNCYESGAVTNFGDQSNDMARDGAFVGNNEYGTNAACYWSSSNNTAFNGIGSGSGNNDGYTVSGMAFSDMQSQTFADTLNKNIGSYLSNLSYGFLYWYFSPTINGGFPYLD